MFYSCWVFILERGKIPLNHSQREVKDETACRHISFLSTTFGAIVPAIIHFSAHPNSHKAKSILFSYSVNRLLLLQLLVRSTAVHMASFEPDLFMAQVYAVVCVIPRGRVASYGQVARLVGYPKHARHVGNALKRLPGKL